MSNSIQLTPNFTSKEYACKHCGEVKVMPKLAALVQKIRDYYGSPIIIISGYRCPIHNARVGGSDTSEHLKGEAADIASTKPNGRMELINLIEKLIKEGKLPELGSFGWKSYTNGCIHVGIRRNANGSIRRW